MYKIIAILIFLSFNCFADQDPTCIAKIDCKCRCIIYNQFHICLCSVPCKTKIPEISAKIDKENNKIELNLP